MKNIIYSFIVTLFSLTTAGPSLAQSSEATALEDAYEKRYAQDWDGAQAAAYGLGDTIITWHKLRAGVGSFSEYQSFLKQHSDWPGLPLLAQKGEEKLTDATSAQTVIDYMSAFSPSTGQGALRLIRAHEQKGATDAAAAQAVITWRDLDLNAQEESQLLASYANTLAPHHQARLDMLLGASRFEDAARVAQLLPNGWSAVTEAARKLAKDEDGVDDAIAAVPSALQGTPAIAYERFAWRARKGRVDDAVTLMLDHSVSRAALGQPERWGNKRRALARQMMRDGKNQIAYAAASRHYLRPDEDHYADLEWLSGYIALRFLNQPARALEHFNRFRLSVKTPISLGRAGYWEGRALDAMGAVDDARSAYTFGAQFQTSFYGLLAAERAGIPMDPALKGEARYDDYRTARFMKSSVLRAALLLDEAGDKPLAARFMRHLGESLSPQELGQLGDLALDTDPYLSVLVAKFAANQGVVLNRAYYPLTDFVTGNLPVPTELALSIARRESEFYPRARSHAGAAGLMQLMPATGGAMAKRVGLTGFETNDLYTPSTNVRLGSAYLGKLIDDYGNNMPLVAAGYNAGPRRANEWIERYGDPRSSSTDAIDWVEHIPFRETRNYVMRVMESLPAYRARLSNSTAPLTLSKDLQAR
jgi:soluble lytic murein transglycosylase